MADLATITDETYQPDTGQVLELLDANGAPLMNDDGTQMTLTLLGKDSDVVVRHINSVSNRHMAQLQRLKLTAEGNIADGTKLLAKATTDWNVTIGGTKPPYSYEAAATVYSNPKLAFIREQADLFIADRSNFYKASPKS